MISAVLPEHPTNIYYIDFTAHWWLRKVWLQVTEGEWKDRKIKVENPFFGYSIQDASIYLFRAF